MFCNSTKGCSLIVETVGLKGNYHGESCLNISPDISDDDNHDATEDMEVRETKEEDDEQNSSPIEIESEDEYKLLIIITSVFNKKLMNNIVKTFHKIQYKSLEKQRKKRTLRFT